MTEAERQQHLDRTHQIYHDINQREAEENKLMVQLNHPFAKNYQLLRKEFDRLKYCENFGKRYVYFKDTHNFAVYQAPQLCIESESLIRGTNEAWKTYMESIADAGWRKETNPKLDVGVLNVYSETAAFIGRLFGLSQGCQISFLGKEWVIDIRDISAKQMLSCLNCVRKSNKRWVLPDRTEVDEVWDDVEVDLGNKKLIIANVDKVTQTATTVQVPLIPMGESFHDLLSKVLEDLLILVYQGFPYSEVRKYLTNHKGKAMLVTIDYLQKLDREFLGRY